MEDISLVDLGHDDVDGQECKDGRSRTWMILLYEDDPTHKAVLDGKLNELDWNFAGCVHDMDKDVKKHHHIVCLFKDGRKKADVANDLGIDVRWLRAWDRQKKALRYLCHKDHPHKFQYSTESIYGTIAEKAVSLCSKNDSQSEGESVREIIDLLNSIEGYITFRSFFALTCEKGLFTVFRRMGILAVRLIDEHNANVRNVLAEEIAQQRIDNERQEFTRFLHKEQDFVERCERLEQLGFDTDKL